MYLLNLIVKVLLGDYRDKKDLLDHIKNNIPYDGSGDILFSAHWKVLQWAQYL